MNAKTQQQLIELNRRFYAVAAETFDATRRDPWPGWERAIAHLASDPQRPLRVLDVGCGNGRFASFLATRFGDRFRYLGLDSSSALLARARDVHAQRSNTRFLECNVLDPAAKWTEIDERFDLIAVFGLLHHVPGVCLRETLLERSIDLLAPGATLVATAWQFGQGDRFLSRTLSWADYNATTDDPIDLDQLEPGDHLLRFADAALPRYCHFAPPEHLRSWLTCDRVEWLDAFSADGRSGDLNRYAVVRRIG